MLALDHRDAFRNAFLRAGVADVDDETQLETKWRIGSALAVDASAIMLDPVAARLCRPPKTPVIVPLEAQGHVAVDGGRIGRLESGFSPERAAELDAAACKLLLYYRPDHMATAGRQRELVANAAEACHRVGLPLVVEPLVYPLEGEDSEQFKALSPRLIAQTAEDFASSEVDLLKLQFPDADDPLAACAEVTRGAGPKPWALLGGSDVDADTFAHQLEMACRAGAAGFIAGRTIWGAGLGLEPREQRQWLDDVAKPLFDRLVEIAERHAAHLPAASHARAS